MENLTKIESYAFESQRYITTFDLTKIVYLGAHAFEACQSLLSITWGTKLTAIPDFCFAGDYQLWNDQTTINFPSCITKIGNSAFSSTFSNNFILNLTYVSTLESFAFTNCVIQSVILSSSLKNLSDNVFSYCSYLSSVTFSENSSLVSIEDSAFYSTVLNDFTLPPSCTFIGENAFYGTSISHIDLSHVTSLGFQAFGSCSNLYLVIFSNGAFSGPSVIPENCFYMCYNLRGINLSNVKTISSYAFAQCTSLTAVVWGNVLQTIDDFAFDSDPIFNISIPASIINISDNSFSSCSSVKYLSSESESFRVDSQKLSLSRHSFDSNVLLVVVDFYGNFTVPEDITDYTESTFRDHKGLTGVSFKSEKITEIHAESFSGCINLTWVDAPYISTIEREAFINTNLKSFSVCKSLFKIGSNAFKGCSNLVSINFSTPSKLERIEDGAFSETGLTNVDLPDSINFLGVSAFFNSDLTYIKLPTNLYIIAAKTFQNCNALTDIKFGRNLSKISISAFENTALKEIVIPDSVITIENGAFYQCTNLTSVKLGLNTSNLLANAFAFCSSLSKVVLGENLKIIDDSAFGNTPSLRSIYIPASVSTIHPNAFAESGLVSITVSENSSDFASDEDALYTKDYVSLLVYPRCRGTKYTVNERTKVIGQSAFLDVEYLSELTLPTITVIYSTSFTNAKSIKEIYVPNEEILQIVVKNYDPELINNVSIKVIEPSTTTDEPSSTTDKSHLTKQTKILLICLGTGVILIIAGLVVALVITNIKKRKLLEKTNTMSSLTLDTTFV